MSEFEVRGLRYEVRGAKYEVRGTRFEVRSAKFEISFYSDYFLLFLLMQQQWIEFHFLPLKENSFQVLNLHFY